MSQQIDILPSHKINAEKWNNCVANAQNGLIYSRYEYLQAMCDNWHGVVVDDYDAVMALPWRKKFGIRYYYEPAFIQQLGLISDAKSSNLQKIIVSFAKYGDIIFNFRNRETASQIKAKERTNLVIDLAAGMDHIASTYKKDLLQNLKKAEKANLLVVFDLSIEEAIAEYRSHYHDRFTHITAKEYKCFENLARNFASKEMCFTRKVCNSLGELMAIGLFLKDEKRVYNLMNTITEAGRKAEANHFLINTVIKEFAGEKLLFDFEGSDLPGVKSFYEKFGAVNQPYYHWHFNQLPFPLRLLKR